MRSGSDRMKTQRILLLIISILILCTGCSTGNADAVPADQEKNSPESSQKNTQNEKQLSVYADSVKRAEGYKDIYEKAANENKLGSLEFKRQVIQFFGEEGCVAVDRENQIDMTHYEQVEDFCQKAQNKQDAEVEIFSILNEGQFIRYDLRTSGGKIQVIISSIEWADGSPRGNYYHEFEAYTWKYTEGGYFFIEEYHPPGFDGDIGQTGFRVIPLDQTCRDLNQQYVYPVGYTRNKLLISDWNEQDYSDLDFYDLYEILYRLKTGSYLSYLEHTRGAEFEIPENEFEEVLQTYFQISSEQIQENTVYHADSQTYRYRPRGMYDAEFAYEPYPEVTACEEQEDGTIKLTINAVWERKLLDCAFVSELVVRPLENGQYQYVSNTVIHSDQTIEPEWYTPRLSDEAWASYYGEQ
ncbi:DUF6070 family protein [Hespellia stercorisuis]|uniref:Uncharacterized protein n=1 Tax=Hespellia stercorisuis DSM 15480 TaxID=1121950 RepID=A0A1M6UGA6_9FIRM|nr:DUF6070 family protein [Hespellia stercorisuis]SHK68201.1 hypothetical protein SAMN02745243_03494 [Hespellia stercorisuis DSM 15480]